MTDTDANPFAADAPAKPKRERDPNAPVGKTVYHPTLVAMATIDATLERAVRDLDPAAREQVLRFAAGRCAELLAGPNGQVRL